MSLFPHVQRRVVQLMKMKRKALFSLLLHQVLNSDDLLLAQRPAVVHDGRVFLNGEIELW